MSFDLKPMLRVRCAGTCTIVLNDGGDCCGQVTKSSLGHDLYRNTNNGALHADGEAAAAEAFFRRS